MKIRPFEPGDEVELRRLFNETIRSIGASDYTPEQLEAWASRHHDANAWRKQMRRRKPAVAIIEQVIVGYADVQRTGLIDHFFVHPGWQRRGVGRRLMAEIERQATALDLRSLHSNVSITARPFFEAHGFTIAHSQEVEIGKVVLKNYRMNRTLPIG